MSDLRPIIVAMIDVIRSHRLQWVCTGTIETELKQKIPAAAIEKLKSHSDMVWRPSPEFPALTEFRFKGPLKVTSEDKNGLLALFEDVSPFPLKRSDVEILFEGAAAALTALVAENKVLIISVSSTHSPLETILNDGTIDKPLVECLYNMFSSNVAKTFSSSAILEYTKSRLDGITFERCRPVLKALKSSKLICQPLNLATGKPDNEYMMRQRPTDLVASRPAKPQPEASVEVKQIWSNSRLGRSFRINDLRTEAATLGQQVLPVSVSASAGSSKSKDKPTPAAAAPATSKPTTKRKLPQPRKMKDVYSDDLAAISRMISNITGKPVDLKKEL